LTNDGELAYRLTHPRFGVEKRYRARVKGSRSRSANRMARGCASKRVDRPGKGPAAPTGPRPRPPGDYSYRGRKRQVKRMCAACGHPVERLRRTGFAFLTAEGLQSGIFRHLSGAEVRRLYRFVGLPPPG